MWPDVDICGSWVAVAAFGTFSLELLSRRAWCWQNWSAAESQGSAGVLSSSQKKHNVFIYCRASPSAFSCTCLWLKWWLCVDFFIRPGFISKGARVNSSTRTGFLRDPQEEMETFFYQASEGNANMPEHVWMSRRKPPFCASPSAY